MKVKELFQHDLTSWRLENQGVSSNNDEDLDTLRYELRTFVCEGEYHTGLAKILSGYLSNLGGDQKAAWVSGFYGSGKSHLVKVLRYLWTDFSLGDGQTARTIATLPHDVSDLLKELTTQGKRGVGLHSAGGTLKAGTGSVRLRTLGLILRSVGLPEKLSLAELQMDLRDDGTLDAIEKSIRKGGKDPATEFEKPYSSTAFQKAYLEHHENVGDLAQVAQMLLAAYPARRDEVSIDDMLKVVRRALSREGKLPSTVVVLDEVQQFIGSDGNLALEVQEIVEACSKQLDGQVLFVGTGQSALSDTPALQRLMGRFTIKVHLRDNDVERVVRTVVLRKKEDKKKGLQDLILGHAGEIARQLKSTKLATRSDDDRIYVADYPILPVRRRFWEHVLHSVDPSGTAAQMRTQLRVAYEACVSVAERDVGAVIPGDFLYDQLANDLVMSGEMQKRFQEIIDEQKERPNGELRSRICGLVFLISKLPHDGADTGVRATVEHLGDLLTDDLDRSATAIREQLPALTDQLRADGVLMDVDGEFRLQTTEGAEWEAEYRRRRSALLNSEAQIAAQRGQELSKAIQKELGGLSQVHGQAKVARKAVIHHGSEAPEASEGLVVWVRDGFQESESSVLQDIQRRSVEDPTIHALIPKSRPDELKQALAGEMAAEQTLNFMGNPTAKDGQEARASMVTRQSGDGQRVAGLIAEIIRGARVLLSGGQEIQGSDLKGAVQKAAVQVLQRLYPKFDMGDSPNWGTVWRKAKEGNANALSVVNYAGDPDNHPVASQVMSYIGAGKKGADVLAHFGAPPYGWAKDAVDAVLAVLLQSGHLAGRLQGRAVALSDLDQRKIGQADFRLQHPVLSPAQKLKIKKLFQDGGYAFTPGNELEAAPGFLQLLRTLARAAGGDPPAPLPPQAPELTEIEGLGGNDLLFALFEKESILRGKVSEWKKTAGKIEQRLPNFRLAQRLVEYGAGLQGFDEYARTLEAVSANRSLLHDPDPVSPVLKAVGGALRTAVTTAHTRYQDALAAERERIDRQPAWTVLPENKRRELLTGVDISERPLPPLTTDQDLAQAIDTMSLASWRTLTDALPARFNQLLLAAIKEAEPKARRVALPAGTIKTEEELDAWLGQVREKVATELKQGPVIL